MSEITSAPARRPLGRKDVLFFLGLVMALFLVYQPAWHGGLLWDDDQHLTRPELRSIFGLGRIWFDVGATLQYYPLLHSTFWLEHRLWGDATLGYHLVNIALHALAAVLVLAVLRRLELPGACLAAAIFALHPVQVESVAWISEQKNTLSAVFYLGATLLYLRFDRTRKLKWYAAAAGVFVLAVLSKTVTATLPGALLVIFWWQRGRLSWKKDVLPLVPYFLLGAGGGMITAWWELKINGCVGPDFTLTLAQRLLIAGRSACFCCAKLLWPAGLTFSYPRWQVDTRVWWQYLFPLGAAAMLALSWAIRRWSRAPLASLMFFGGTLFPVLGFFNLYTFRYSFVADHYQYLASLGIITLFSAGMALLLQRVEGWKRTAFQLASVALLAALAVLSWRQSQIYADVDTLYRTTIDRNPDCWLAHNNLGLALAGRGQIGEAIAHYERALEIKSDYALAHNNLANALSNAGRLREAIEHLQRAVQIKPDFAEAHVNLGAALNDIGRYEEAVEHYQDAVRIQPDNASAHYNWGSTLFHLGRLAEAIEQYREAVRIKPDHAKAHNNLGNALAGCGQVDEAVAQYRKALEIKPDFAEVHHNLGNAFFRRGQVDEAIVHYRKALQIKPDNVATSQNLARVQAERERILKALAARRESLRLRPNDVALLNDTAWMLATNPNESIRNGSEAVKLAEGALKLSSGHKPAILGTLAAAYAEAGRFSDAIRTAEEAVRLAVAAGDRALAAQIRTRVDLYRSGKPYRQLVVPPGYRQP